MQFTVGQKVRQKNTTKEMTVIGFDSRKTECQWESDGVTRSQEFFTNGLELVLATPEPEPEPEQKESE